MSMYVYIHMSIYTHMIIMIYIYMIWFDFCPQYLHDHGTLLLVNR